MDAEQFNRLIDDWRHMHTILATNDGILNRIKEMVIFLQSKGQVMEEDYCEHWFHIWTSVSNVKIFVHLGDDRKISKINLSFVPNDEGRDIWRGEFEKCLFALFGYEFITVEGDDLEKFDYVSHLEKLLQISTKFSVLFPTIKAILAMFEENRRMLLGNVGEMLRLTLVTYDKMLDSMEKGNVLSQ